MTRVTTTAAASGKRNAMTRKLRFFGYLFILPATLMVLLTTIIPVGWNIVLSFCEWNGNSDLKFVGLANYVNVFTDYATVKTIGHSLAISVVAAAVAMILGISLALMIYKVNKKEGAFYRFVFYSPGMLPMTVVGLLFTFVLATDQGLVNNLLETVGLGAFTQPWLAKKGLVLVVIGVVQGWRSSGAIMMLTYTAILSLPESLFESAKLDGASYWQEIRRVILPLIKPSIKMVFSMMVMWAFKTYDIVATMTGGGPGDLSKTAPIRIIEQAFTYNKFGYASALSLVFAVLIIALILLVRKCLGGEAYEY